MALIGLKIPAEISRIFTNVKVPGERDPSDHVTMFYISGELKPKDIAKVCAALPGVLENITPFEAVVKTITCFPEGDEGVPIVGDVISKELTGLRIKIVKLLNKEKIEYSKKFSKFKPHVTLSYSNDKIDNIKLPTPAKWLVTELILWSGDQDDSGIIITFPLYEKVSAANIALALADVFCKLAHV
ncbi:hypothetical protein LCGC14_0413610 [marine sediment metagenome]|uniref:Phosphoesterase HXTX domain-containing protein n=1 Tax=marine sediment metagenome TaxID=412755 RepID=A0A0F9SYX4_9ZZZZ